jgi:hypothetical protein
MARVLLGLAAVVLAGLAAVKPATSDIGLPARATQQTLYGVNWQGSLGLVRLDRETLRPVGERRVRLAAEPLGWSFAPDRSRLVLGSTARGATLRLIDLRAMRRLGDVRVADRGSGIATTWVGPRRVLAVVVTPGCCGAGDTIVSGVDTGRRRVVWRRTLGGSLQAGERWRRGLLLVLGPRRRSVGPSRLVWIGPRGGTRSTSVPEIRSGNAPDGSVTQSWNPGLAVDRRGARAFVVQANAPLAEVDLRTFGVRSHPLERPAQAADAVVGPTRHALWLGREMLAITGFDSHSSGDQPAGLTIVDTRSWRSRLIDQRTTDAALVSGTLLASSFLGTRSFGSGLTGYSRHGARRWHRFGSSPIWGVQPIGRNALVGGPSRIALIEAATGRQLRRYRRFTTSVLAADAPFHY